MHVCMCVCMCVRMYVCMHVCWYNLCIYITKYGSTLYIGMDEVFQHRAHTFEKSDLKFHFQCEFSSVATEW